MAWLKVLPVDTLSEGEKKVVKVGSRSVLLVNHSGQFYAVDSICPHLKLSLKKGKVTPEGEIVCPWHRSAFNLCTGNVASWTPWPPGVGKILGMVSSEKALPVFPTRVEEGSIWVDVEG